MKLKNIALGSIWDPLAVKICHSVGENKFISLSFGSKISPSAGGTIKKKVLVKKDKKSLKILIVSWYKCLKIIV